ncbi:2-dehydropantoate 2-reductase N-terminal domain-containing protein [Thermopolyspora sp. NPDC052614]|uniref:ketopantoate reductase family protein n=1 Tax=Thermopolyspora sp. NPDC052614 TaxID=3155682 RepID=UPI00343D43DC
MLGPMRYIIIGAGAIGGTIGGRLFEGGHDVVLVARGAHHRALRDEGLRLVAPQGSATLPIPAVQSPDELRLTPDDVLVLCVKTQDSLPALQAWADRPVDGGGTAAERLPLVCAQNAVENERLALRLFARVYGMCVWLPAAHLDPGVVAAYGTPLNGILHVGRYPSGLDDTARRIAEDLSKNHLLGFAEDRVMRWKYAKLLNNLLNAYDAVCDDRSGRRAIAPRVRAEGYAAFDAAGIAYVTQDEERARRGDQVVATPIPDTPPNRSSSWQSLTRRSGSIETDYLNGEIALLGRLHGVPTPANDALRRLANRFARERRAPGSMSLQEVIAAIDAAEAGALP